MPELTVIHIVLIAAAALAGIVLGWIVRGNRTVGEKAAINAGWQEQMEAQRGEHERLLDQNKSLMEQNSQYQASNKDAKMRASELSDALKEAFERRDELQRQIKEIRSNLETAVSERDLLQSKAKQSDSTAAALRERDDKIEKLNRELENWQGRLPPLIERYKQRNEEAEQLERDLDAALERIAALEAMVGSEETRVEPVDRDALGDDLDASNEPMDDESEDLVAAEELIEDDPADDNDAGDEVLDATSADVDEADDPGTDAATGEWDDPAGEQDEQDDDDDAWAGAGDDDWGTAPDADEPDGLQRDDLKSIKGVGPAIEKTLNEMGIFRFNQIAEMSEYDIDRIAHRLKGFRSRIYREDWMGQARELQLKKASG